MNRASKSSDPKPRQRAAQACGTCRSRKVRCDAGVPKCGLCVSLDVDCVYLEPEVQRIDPSTRLLLERIQKLEDRIFAAPERTLITSGAQSIQAPEPASPDRPQNESIKTPESTTAPRDFRGASQGESLTLPPMHDANTNNVYQWTVVQSLLSEDHVFYGFLDPNRSHALPEATDIFLLSNSGELHEAEVASWHLFEDATCGEPINRIHELSNAEQEARVSQLEHFNGLIQEFFLNVHVFYPLISQPEVYDMLQTVAQSEIYRSYQARKLSGTKYCLLLVILCLGAVAKEQSNLVFSDSHRDSNDSLGKDVNNAFHPPAYGSDNLIWAKAKLLLGIVSFDGSIEAAQCFALSSIYLGSKGRTLESHQQIHIAARKVGMLAKRALLQSHEETKISDSFCRLFWVTYVLESDFAMELTLTPPSGITRFEEMVRYPASEQTSTDHDINIPSPSGHLDYTTKSTNSTDLNLAAFQISTNSAIRRFLNRITAVIYNPQETWRKQHQNSYANWLLKITNELQSHHEAIHTNLPSFLLSTDERFLGRDIRNTTTEADHRKFANHLWNVSRLRGRYCAGQYLICRASFEFVLLNPDAVDSHPSGQEILDKCRSCINSCVDFIRIFNVEPANSMTNLFATGMATFAMVIILMISTTSTRFQHIVPSDMENIIKMGQQNLRQFSLSVKEFEWHLKELERIDRARKARRPE